MGELERFNVKTLAAEGMPANLRIREPLHIYAVVSHREDDVRAALTEREKAAFDDFLKHYGDLNFEVVAIEESWPDDMPREYWKHLKSFSCEWHRPEHERKVKNMFRACVKRELIAKSPVVSIKDGFAACGLKPSNGYAFLAGNDDAVSYKKAAALARWSREKPKTAE